MKKFFILLPVCCLLALFPVRAQNTENDLTTDFQGRISAGVSKKIIKGLHVNFDAQMRLKDNFGKVGRVQAGVDVSYKPLKWLKTSVGYLFMENRNSSGVWKMRHRLYADLAASVDFGSWRFSLKERLQLTHKDVGNGFQHVPNLLELKSRLKVTYRGWQYWRPYAFVELRNCFNEPTCSAKWNGSSYTDYQFLGYTSGYLNRVRGALGVEWHITREHALDFYLMADYCHEKNIDTNKEGTILKSLTWDRSVHPVFGIGYKFSF